jgi:hypothetical protein
MTSLVRKALIAGGANFETIQPIRETTIVADAVSSETSRSPQGIVTTVAEAVAATTPEKAGIQASAKSAPAHARTFFINQSFHELRGDRHARILD